MALTLVELHTAPMAKKLTELAWQRWSWGALLSPSAYVCWGVILGSVLAPIQGISIAFGLLTARQSELPPIRRRYFYAVALTIAVLALPFITDTLLWGTFPFTYDSDGVGRLRLIPFLPWPDAPYGSY